MTFIQIIDFRTARIAEAQKHVDEWFQKTEGRRTARRGLLCQDRDDPGRYLNIVFFDSYESAMENSALPETGQLAERLGALGDGPSTFVNLEVVQERP